MGRAVFAARQTPVKARAVNTPGQPRVPGARARLSFAMVLHMRENSKNPMEIPCQFRPCNALAKPRMSSILAGLGAVASLAQFVWALFHSQRACGYTLRPVASGNLRIGDRPPRAYVH